MNRLSRWHKSVHLLQCGTQRLHSHFCDILIHSFAQFPSFCLSSLFFPSHFFPPRTFSGVWYSPLLSAQPAPIDGDRDERMNCSQWQCCLFHVHNAYDRTERLVTTLIQHQGY